MLPPARNRPHDYAHHWNLDHWNADHWNAGALRTCPSTNATNRRRLIASATVSAERVFMTYVETAAMNAPFKEAEAVLLHERGRRTF